MSTMRAVRIHEFGGPDVLRIEQLPVPEPKDDEILLAIHAASINPVDYKIRAGTYPRVTATNLPITLGRDASGVVAAVGPGVTRFKVGDAIFGMAGGLRGCYAEYVILKQDEAAAKPANLDHIHAAAVPLAGLTAWQALFDHGGLTAGQRVLIHAGSGGVGHFAIQFAKAKGATVITTASGDGLAFVRDLGADEAIDYKTQRFEEMVKDVDMVFDTMAGDVQERSWGVIKPGGILITILGQPDEEKAKAHGVRSGRMLCQPNGAQLAGIGALIEAGKVRPQVQATFPLEQIAQAQDAAARGPIRGKVVVTVGG